MRKRAGIRWVFSILLLSGYSHPASGVEPGAPSAPDQAWVPPDEMVEAPAPAPDSLSIPPDLISRIDRLTLTDLIDLALLANPNTRATWLDARAAQEEYRAEKGAYYPGIDLALDATRVHGSAVGGRFTFDQETVVPSVALGYTIYDFGKRGAQVEERRQALIAADWNHNAMIQRIVLEVQQAYYRYLDAKALMRAEEVTVEEASTSLEAAEERHSAGVATIADVLQARTGLSQAELSLAITRGEIQAVRGAIATALGVSPVSDFDVQDELPEELPLEQASRDVEGLIREAHARRPDLAAARARAAEAGAHARALRREGWPVIEGSGLLQRVHYLDPQFSSTNYSAELSLRFPLFTGFRHTHEVRQAEEEHEAGWTRARQLTQEVTLQVWVSYFNVKTSTERIETSRHLLESAEQSHEVASGRYKAGVGGIIELLSAQAALENARAELIRAKTDWLLAMAQLAYDTGTLWISTEGGK